MMQNYFASLENSLSKIRTVVLCCRRKTSTCLILTAPSPFLYIVKHLNWKKVYWKVRASENTEYILGAFLSVQMTYIKINICIDCQIDSLISCQGTKKDLDSPSYVHISQQRGATGADHRRKRQALRTQPRSVALGWASALWSSTVGGSWCAPGARFPVWSHPRGISLHTPGLLQNYTQAQQVGMTRWFPYKTVWTISLTWTFPADHSICCHFAHRPPLQSTDTRLVWPSAVFIIP